MACRALAPRARLWVASPSYHQAQQVRPTPSDLPARLGPSCSQPRVREWEGWSTDRISAHPASARRLQSGRRSSGPPAALALATNEGRGGPRRASVSWAPPSGQERDSPGPG